MKTKNSVGVGHNICRYVFQFKSTCIDVNYLKRRYNVSVESIDTDQPVKPAQADLSNMFQSIKAFCNRSIICMPKGHSTSGPYDLEFDAVLAA